MAAAIAAAMKKHQHARRLHLTHETLRSLSFETGEVGGGGTILDPSKPQASCFIVCLPTNARCVQPTIISCFVCGPF
jgi:hypothetical protein